MVTMVIIFISATPQDVYVSVSDERLLSVHSSSASRMTYKTTYHIPRPWKYTDIECVIPPAIDGRFVYAYLMGDGDIYVRQLEVFPPFSYSQ